MLVALTFAGAPARAALWYESYADAQRALADEDWASALQYASDAVAERPESGTRVRTYGMNFIDYFPYLTMGIAHYNLGEYDEALAAFEKEEAQGYVQRAPQRYEKLQELQTRIEEQKRNAAAERAQQARKEAIQRSLERARRLESDGKLAEALTEYSQVLTLESDNPEAATAVGRLRVAIQNEDKARQQQQRVDTLVQQGRAAFEREDFSEAASRLNEARGLESEALGVTIPPEVQDLYEEAQRKLRDRLQARQDEQLQQLIANSLTQAQQQYDSNRYDEALSSVQSVLALDANNPTALRLRLQAQRAKASTYLMVERQQRVDQLFEDLVQAESEDDGERALVIAENILAWDDDNPRALDVVRSAISRRIGQALAGADVVNLELDKDLNGLKYGKALELVSDPHVTIAGEVFSLSRVSVAISRERLSPEGIPASPEIVEGATVDSQSLGPGFGYRTTFELRDSIVPGAYVYRVEATEEVTSKSYEDDLVVMYVVPWFKRLEFQIGAGAFVILALGTYTTLRNRKRAALRKRKFNPFIAGAPIRQAELFYGRERLLQRVLQTVHNNSILLYGERRIGKTSFQHHLKRRLEGLDDPEFTFFPVFIDLQGTPEERFFATLAEDIFSEDGLGPLLGDVEPSPKLQQPETYDHRDFVRDLKKVLKALEQHTEKRVKLVMLIDEVDELNRYDPRVNQKLRSLFMRSFAENLVAVVSGVGIRKHWESEGSPWYNFFEEIPVEPFRREDAEQLIVKPMQGMFKVEAGVVDRILEATEYKPFRIQSVCRDLVKRGHERRRRTISVADVDAVLKNDPAGTAASA